MHDPRAASLHCEAVLCLILYFVGLLSSVESSKETEKSSEKGDTDSPLTKTEDKENKPGIHAMNQWMKWVQMVQ